MKPTGRSVFLWILAIGVLALAPGARAQDAIMSAPETDRLPAALRDALPPSPGKPPRPPGTLLSFGPLSVHPHLMTRAIYGLGLPTSGGRHVASMIYTTAPGVTIDAGSHWTFDYTPTWVSYTARALDDTLDHSASLQGVAQVQKWVVQGSENYAASSPILFETGRQTKQTMWATQLGASRSFDSGLLFSTSASLNERYGEVSPDTRDWATMNWLTLQISRRLEAGLGLGAGYSDIVAQPDATYERYMGRLNWNPTDKLSLSIDGGMESRHSRSAAATDMNNPILSSSLIYRPFATTSISVSGSRTVANSYFAKQVTRNSSWGLNLEQRLLGRLYFSTSYSRQQNDFEAVSPLAAIPVIPPEDPAAEPASGAPIVSLPGRSDRTDSFSARLTTQLLKRWTLAATFSRSRNRSSQADFAFTTTQFGLEAGCRF